MVQTRSHKAKEQQCMSPTSSSLKNYEDLRQARIAENLARLAELGVEAKVKDIKDFLKIRKFTKRTTKSLEFTPVRRSERLKSIPNKDSDCSAENSYENGFERKINSARHYYTDSEKGLPANAPLPKCSRKDLQMSPALLSHRCNSPTRGSIYDSVLGICCHFCRQKKLCGEDGCERCGNRDPTKACLGKTDCSICHSSTGVYCRGCLKIRYGEDLDEVRKNKNWICPHCSEEKGINPYWICNSSLCLKKRKIPPTGIAIFKAREMGYESVAHYLEDILKEKYLCKN